MIERLIKPANAFLAGYSYLKSSITGKAAVSGMPVSISAELTNNCNLHCPECSSGSGQMKRDRGFMDIDLYNKFMKGISPYLYNVNLYFQGEPMLHPQFFLFVRGSINTHTVVSTNGHFLSEENSEKLVKSQLSKLIISLDGVDQDTYSAYRINGSVNSVLDGIRNVTNAKKKYNSSLKIEIQFLVNRLNENQIPQVRQLANTAKASLNLKSMQIINKEDIRSWLPLNDRFRRYKMKDGEYVIKNSLPDRCFRLWFNPVITWDGKVIPCCFDKNAEYTMGDLNHDSFREIWDGPKYRIFRKSILSGRHMIEICRNCTSGLRSVKY
jgi:radical SAM protein with 4Fe4S-binding SPASM domain